MKIYFYSKLDRGYFESAYPEWRKQGGAFIEHLERQQSLTTIWKREFARQGHSLLVDVRSSYLVPQTLRAHLPLPLGSLVRGALWVTAFDRWLLYRDLIRRIDALKPASVFIGLGSAVWESTLRELKRRGVQLWQWVGLPASTMLARDRVNLPYFDLIFQPANLEQGLRAAGARGRIVYVPQAVDPEVYRPLDLTAEAQARYQSDVCFIGGLDTRFHGTRRQMIEFAIEHGVNMKIWGGYREHFRGSPVLKCWQGQIWGEDQIKALCATKIGLNMHVDHAAHELDRGLNLRAFELAACGVFQLLQYVPGVHEFFEVDKEIVCFETKEEMLDKIRYYLAHETERQQIANTARQRVVRDHTWAKRIKWMAVAMENLVRD